MLPSLILLGVIFISTKEQVLEELETKDYACFQQ